MEVYIRWMMRRDMPEVLAIENESFEFPWFDRHFHDVLSRRNCIGMVAEHDERVVGFMIYELHQRSLGLLNFCVHPSHRRRAVGIQMVDKLKGKLSQQRRTSIALEVRETNVVAQVFFRAMGFEAVNILRQFYTETNEDAYKMEYHITPRERQIDGLCNELFHGRE